MESLLKEWDGESVIIRYHRSTGTWIIIAIHSTHLGPAIGGTRMKTYSGLRSALQDVHRLARGMTYKWAAAGFEAGGGKGVLAVPPDLDPQKRASLLRSYGKLIAQLKGLFMTGPDVGTSSADMDVIAETGEPYVFSRTPAAGGAGSPGPFTALGVFTALQATAENVYGDPSLKDKKVLVQGAGSVGGGLIALLREEGAEILFSDVNESAIKHFRDELGLPFIPPELVFETHCDIFAPCALGGILNAETIPSLRCRAVAGGANNQLATPEDADRMQARGIQYAPDFVANCGGATAITGMEMKGWSKAEATQWVIQAVRSNLDKIFDLAAAEGITTDAAAQCLAESRLA